MAYLQPFLSKASTHLTVFRYPVRLQSGPGGKGGRVRSTASGGFAASCHLCQLDKEVLSAQVPSELRSGERKAGHAGSLGEEYHRQME